MIEHHFRTELKGLSNLFAGLGYNTEKAYYNVRTSIDVVIMLLDQKTF